MTLYGLFRGRNISTGEVEQSVSQLLINKRKNKEFSEWIESSISLAYCNTPPKGATNSVQILSNYAGIHRVFTDLVNKFRQQFTKKSYLHYYLQEGMEEFQFSEALSNLTETCFEYNQYSQDVLFNQDDSSVEE
ncbi:tubulin/FtsZ family, carboxy-terminal domain protein (macronuclear) [Tetrahymena thermophila SB210]|uniref:Tubulin/FtsZ family, carboxy-terminal domain protein n=1 Tax=Tetrahymena thermophila (strain SB210) TaxID=312017 RepID=Q22E27_TETTS|nr:tubulin/FtsZ family, carboxy-terminal domain protein [Tetrahymena thermophila SB210]EAR83587.2 tubulin/FtsZ family, carboxy-terminal domain protein [Tetrahymena thermophila SB210]|eukprot:XP_001031250.2 tubulin/FtsZ family, carboxy-terminal domain protein [Tetrahymena thermophila SB210]